MNTVNRTAIETRRHYLSHLREPKGRGGWLFENQEEKIVFSFNGTYAEAKREAIKFGAAAGLCVLYVCP